MIRNSYESIIRYIHENEPLLVLSESEAHGCELQYKAGFVELSDTEGAAVIVISRHDGSSIS